MAHYIDADKLIKSVNNYQEGAKAALNPIDGDADYYKGKIDACEDMKEFITSLQQEQPEQKKNCAECPHCVDRKDQFGWYFKACFGGPYKGKFIAEIDECPLQQEQPDKDKKTFDDYLKASPSERRKMNMTEILGEEKLAETKKQMEQPEVDLEEEIDKEWRECYPIDEGMGDEKAILVGEQFHQIARHFAEWGRKHARKEE